RDFPDDLAPAARGDAEVDDGLHALQEAEPLLELEQFVGGAAAIALSLSAADVGVVQLPFEPARRTHPAALGGADSAPQQHPPQHLLGKGTAEGGGGVLPA